MLVVDVSAVFGFIFADERSDYAMALAEYMQTSPVMAPDFFLIEANNIFQTKERRQLYQQSDINDMQDRLLRMNILYRRATRLWFQARALLELQRLYGLTSYDALYLLLAQHYQIPLATQDKKLRLAAERENLFWPGTP
ncbi:MAG: type II toxin-antitoxin system VapC family toxin [Holosporales bacterium]|jgi:predicted nucleic acid-binding protein